MKKGYIYTIIFMLLISAFFSSIVGFADSFYSAKIKTNEDLRIQKSILASINISLDEDKIEDFFKVSIIKIETTDNEYYFNYVDENKNILAIIKEFRGPGLWGTIEGFVSFEPTFDKIIGIDFTNHNETPGLGGRIDEDWFKNQFRNYTISKSQNIEYGPDTGLDAITGATNTSSSVLKILNKLIQNNNLK
jgi:Na+-transporting NADH:ubiquinone oxidoreductase subunit C